MSGPLVGILVALAFVSVIGGIVALILHLVRQRAGEQMRLPVRLLFRIYLYLVIIAGMVLSVQGLSSLVRAGLGTAIEKEFSYTPEYVPVPAPAEPPDKGATAPAEPQDKGAVRPAGPTAEEEAARQKGLDRAWREGLINGVAFTVIGLLVLGSHVLGLRMLQTAEERSGMLHRFYVFAVLVVFTIIVLVTLPQGVFESMRYWLLKPVDSYSRPSPPGQALSTAIVALPVWGVSLWAALRAARRAEVEG